MDISKRCFGHTPEGIAVDLFTLSVAPDFKAEITNFGGIIVSLLTPDRNGKLADVVLGFDNLDQYVTKHPYFGSIVGRFGNRIAAGRFELEGKVYTLAVNNGPNHLHGGLRGFDKAVWRAEPLRRADAVGLKLTHTSPDGDEGYPGALNVEVTYWLTADRTLDMDYHATTDAPTHVNLTNHSYFNLAGHDAGDILRHEMTLYADLFVPVNAALIPTGELRPVQGTPHDFRTPTAIGARINHDDEQLKLGIGYDHTFVMDAEAKGALTRAARVVEPSSGRTLECWTTEPGMQFYTGNFLDGSNTGKNGAVYHHRNGLCLETQHFPDTPNQPQFPSTLLRPGETLRTKTQYKFGTE